MSGFRSARLSAPAGKAPPRPSVSPPPPPSPSAAPASEAPPPPPASHVDPSLLATLSALRQFEESAPSAAGGPSRASRADVPGPLHWLMQLSKEDLKTPYSPKSLQATKYLMKVFSFCDADDLFRVAEVCKEWNVISEHDSLWEVAKGGELKRMEKSLDNQRRRYNNMEKINVRIHAPAKARRPKDFVAGVRKYSKLWSDQPMVLRPFWAKKSQEKSKTADILKSQQDVYVESKTLHTVGDIKCIVIDAGTSLIKAGFSAEMTPSLIIPAVVAYLENDAKEDALWKGLPTLATTLEGDIILHPLGTVGCLVGQEAHDLALSSIPDSKNKVKRYRLRRLTLNEDTKEAWTDWANVLSYIFNHLRIPQDVDEDGVPRGKKEVGVDPSQHPVLITQPIFAARFVRERLTAMLFEDFNVPAVHMSWTPIAAAYGYDTVTGLSLDLGESAVQIVPIFHGTILEPAMRRVAHIAGSNITQYLIDRLPQIRANKYFPGEPFAAPGSEADFRHYQLTVVIKNIKEVLGTVVESYESVSEEEKPYTPSDALPQAHKHTVPIGRVVVDCGELLFQPRRLLDDLDPSIVALPELIQQVVENCSLDLRSQLVENIIISGGGADVPGLVPRLESELKALYKSSSVLAKATKVKCLPDKRHRVWIGAAELARLGMGAQHVWLSRDLYDEVGAWALERAREES